MSLKTSSSSPLSSSSPDWSLRRRVQLCLVMIALESYISFEEIFMLAVLQRVTVPTALVSLPGTISSFIGVLVIPFLGWASDKYTCMPCCGQKRPFALWTLAVAIVGMSILIGVDVRSIYVFSDHIDVSDYNNTALEDLTTMSPSAFAATTQAIFSVGNTSNKAPGVGAVDGGGPGSALGETGSVSLLGILGILGFVLADHGYDSSMSTVKAYFTAVTPYSQHESIFVMGTLIGAIGGCLTSLLGFIDLAALFWPSASQGQGVTVRGGGDLENRNRSRPDQDVTLDNVTGLSNIPDSRSPETQVQGYNSSQGQGDYALDDGVAQCLIQAVILLLSLLILGAVSLTTGREGSNVLDEEKLPADVNENGSNSPHHRQANGKASSEERDTNNGVPHNRPNGMPTRKRHQISNGTFNPTEDPLDRIHFTDAATAAVKRGYNSRNPSREEETPELLLEASYNSDSEKLHLLHGRKTTRKTPRIRKRFFLCVMTFFGFSANYSYFVYVTNYVAQAIFKGDPNADASSDAYARYVDGVHIASLGMLTFYCFFVTFNFLHSAILSRIGMRLEYVGATLCCSALLLTLAATDSIVVFFVNAVIMSVYRSAVYTIPFILVSSYAQQESEEDKLKAEITNLTTTTCADASRTIASNTTKDTTITMDNSNNGSNSSSGIDMACVSAMIPASYFLVSLVMGPLMDITGYPGLPVVMAAGCCIVGLFSTAFVQFS